MRISYRGENDEFSLAHVVQSERPFDSVEIKNALRELSRISLSRLEKKEVNESDFHRAADMAFPSESKKRRASAPVRARYCK